MAEQGSVDEAEQKRRYRLLMAVEGVLLLATWLGCPGLRIAPATGSWGAPLAVILVILFVWHIIAIPICFLYLIGKPIVISFSPLIDTPESRAFQKQLRERPVLDDQEFYARFYEGSGIPREIPARLRSVLKSIHPLFDRAIPSDFLYLLNDDLDFGSDVLDPIGQEFGLRFASPEQEGIDGTLDNLIRLVHKRRAGTP
jgi:hypothetical protein